MHEHSFANKNTEQHISIFAFTHTSQHRGCAFATKAKSTKSLKLGKSSFAYKHIYY